MQGNNSKESFTADMSAFVHQYKSCPDPWIRNGIDVLSHIPTGQAFLQKIEVYSPNRRVSPPFYGLFIILEFQKQLIYEHISDHYRKAGTPVISHQWEEVIQALNNLMSK